MIANDRQSLPKLGERIGGFLVLIAFFLIGIQPLYAGEAEETDNCKVLGCTQESKCRDIFGHHPVGLAVDMGGANNRPFCSFGTRFDSSIDSVVGGTSNLVGSLHSSFLKTARAEGATVFSPLGAFYFSDGEWNKLPPLFTKVLYEKGEGNQNCVIHFHTENSKKPPLVLLRLGDLWLGDKKGKVFDQYGQATEVRESPDGVTAYMFVLDKQKKLYVAIEAFPFDKEYIWSIQVSGADKTPLKGLLGIEIGSEEKDVLSVFGKPTDRTVLKDVPGEFLEYKGRNYSFELNEKKRLRSIKIMVPESFMRYIKRKEG
jgi:hypothetical protein